MVMFAIHDAIAITLEQSLIGKKSKGKVIFKIDFTLLSAS